MSHWGALRIEKFLFWLPFYGTGSQRETPEGDVQRILPQELRGPTQVVAQCPFFAFFWWQRVEKFHSESHFAALCNVGFKDSKWSPFPKRSSNDFQISKKKPQKKDLFKETKMARMMRTSSRKEKLNVFSNHLKLINSPLNPTRIALSMLPAKFIQGSKERFVPRERQVKWSKAHFLVWGSALLKDEIGKMDCRWWTKDGEDEQQVEELFLDINPAQDISVLFAHLRI